MDPEVAAIHGVLEDLRAHLFEAVDGLTDAHIMGRHAGDAASG